MIYSWKSSSCAENLLWTHYLSTMTSARFPHQPHLTSSRDVWTTTSAYASWGIKSAFINVSIQRQVQSALIILQGWVDSLHRNMNSPPNQGEFRIIFWSAKVSLALERAPKWPDDEHTAPAFTLALLWRTFLQLTPNRQSSDKNKRYPDHEGIPLLARFVWS